MLEFRTACMNSTHCSCLCTPCSWVVVAGPSRLGTVVGAGNAAALRPTTSMISTAVQRPQSPGHLREQAGQSPKVYRAHSVVSQTPAAYEHGSAAVADAGVHEPEDGRGHLQGVIGGVAGPSSRPGLQLQPRKVPRGGTPASVYGQISQPLAQQVVGSRQQSLVGSIALHSQAASIHIWQSTHDA